jgi:hypothetical protein
MDAMKFWQENYGQANGGIQSWSENNINKISQQRNLYTLF